MRVTDLLKNASIDLGAKVKDKNDAISHLVDLMDKGGNLKRPLAQRDWATALPHRTPSQPVSRRRGLPQ